MATAVKSARRTRLVFSPRLLREVRLNAGRTQAEVAAVIGSRYDVLARYELGKRVPPADVLADFADFLDVDITAFYTEEAA